MKRTLAVVCGTTLLLSSAHRLPAQVVGEKPCTPAAPAEARSAPAKQKPSDSSGSSSSKRFDGTWRATGSWKVLVGNSFNLTQTLIIKDGVANLTRELTSTLASGKQWTDLHAPYNSSSPLYHKKTNKSTELKNKRSTLQLHWNSANLIYSM